MRGISKSTAGAMRNANAMYKGKGGGNASQKAYSSAAGSRSRSGGSGMASHKAGMSGAGLS